MLNKLVFRLLSFRRDLTRLWHAMWSPKTPLDLKLIALALVLYVLSPIDLIPDFIPIAGLIDDALLVPIVVGWLVSQLPSEPT